MPLVIAFSISRRLSSSGRLQGWFPRSGSPKLIIPRQMRETSRPVAPRRVYSMAVTLACRRAAAKPGLRERGGPGVDRAADGVGQVGERLHGHRPLRTLPGPAPGADDPAVADHGGPEHAVAAGDDPVGELGGED